MAAKLRQIFKMYALYGRMDWQFVMCDKRMGLFTLLCELIGTLSTLSGVALLAVRFDGIGGLTADEVLWMLGFYTLSDGLMWMLAGNYNTLNISRRVGRGQVDHMLIQPCPLWMQLLTEGFMPFSGCSGALVGLALTVYATIQLGISVTPLWLLALLLYCAAHMATLAGAAYLTGAAAFWRPVSCEELSSVALDALYTAGRYPIIALPELLQAILVTVIPIGLVAYLPSMILLNKIDAITIRVWPFAAAAAFASLGGLIFRKGLRYYAAHGCPRYKDMGHRC